MKKTRHFNFKRIDKEQREIQKRNEIIQLMQWYVDDIYYSLEDIEKCIKYAEKDPIIQEKYKELYNQTIMKFNKDLEEIDEILNEEDEDEEIT
jgi:dGTP triphosphohydrolase